MLFSNLTFTGYRQRNFKKIGDDFVACVEKSIIKVFFMKGVVPKKWEQ